ncbi:BTB/POZ domain-containing protein 1-like [Paramacrobiotus metropolitanus]|uniref:BTB/POZ domain-containing protein 1-like n=1 Tax=Paramacrobiotus metropolitanus TaxID=2943436 RepID=UPI002446227F|nr:BTB/POZ domain-containing protein 1-like [Paramacrobiotus metropolitanus]
MSRKSLAIASNPQPRRVGIANRLQGSLRSGELSDVKFTVGRDHGEARTFSAHKYILSLGSDVFYTMFHGSLSERKKIIEIPDDLPEAFEVMLNFMYTDKADLTVEKVWPVFQCADKYDVPLLVEMCTQFVLKQIRPENCLTYLEKAVKWHADDIAELCFSVADAFTVVAFKSQQFTSISQETLRKLLQRDTFLVCENTIYTAVESWCVEACKRTNQDASAANRRAVLGDVLFLVRFPLLSPTQLANGPSKTGLLSERELVDLYSYKHATPKPTNLPFSTELRARMAPFRVCGREFQLQERVFVEQLPEVSFWVPAKVIGIRHSQVLVSMHGLSDAGGFQLVESEKLVRAAIILISGRNLVCHCSAGQHADATYQSPGHDYDRHWIKARGRREEVSFKDIFVRRDAVPKWMTEPESNDGSSEDASEDEIPHPPARKRSRK